jgi:hypothetical protein
MSRYFNCASVGAQASAIPGLAGAVICKRFSEFTYCTGNEKYTLFVKDIATGQQLLSRPIEVTHAPMTRANGGWIWVLDGCQLPTAAAL